MRSWALWIVLWPALASADPPARVSPLRLEPMEPAEWAPSERDECYSRPQTRTGVVARHICDGPRRVPVGEGDARERAERLGLGVHAAYDRLVLGSAPAEWIAEIASTPREDLLWPVSRGLFSRGFGMVRQAEIRHRPHNGLDIVAEEGARIRAANDGLVVYADNGVTGYGNILAILHADGTATFYAHCRAIYVAPGQIVARGQVVGEVGNTGLAERAHLHFEWRRRGEPMDPLARMVERPAYADVRPEGGESFAPPPPNVQDRLEARASHEATADAREARIPASPRLPVASEDEVALP